MTTVVSTQVMAWQAALTASAGVQYSSSVYFTINLTTGLEIRVPVAVRFSLVSADPNVLVYQSHDGGGTFETTPSTGFSIQRIASGVAVGSIPLPTGQYLIQVTMSGPNTSASIQLLTQDVITAFANV